MALGFPPEGGQPKHHMALGLLSLHCSLNARWRFGLGTARNGPRLAWAWQGRTQNSIGCWPQANQAPRGAWTTPPQASSTTPPGAWSASSLVEPKRHVVLGRRLGCLHF